MYVCINVSIFSLRVHGFRLLLVLWSHYSTTTLISTTFLQTVTVVVSTTKTGMFGVSCSRYVQLSTFTLVMYSKPIRCLILEPNFYLTTVGFLYSTFINDLDWMPSPFHRVLLSIGIKRGFSDPCLNVVELLWALGFNRISS